jgi:hypothetical protein
MRNDTPSKVVIEMRDIDNADRFTKRLEKFCNIAATGGDAELFIKHNGEMKDCGFVAHDLTVREISHEISKQIDGGKTKDGHELEIGAHYYNEYGEVVILESVLEDKAHGLTRYLVTPFFEGEALTPCGDGGVHHEISGVYEHLGMPRVINAIFKEPPTPKISADHKLAAKKFEEMGLAIGVVERVILDRKTELRGVTKEHKMVKKEMLATNTHLDIGRQGLVELEEKLKAARQKLSELEDRAGAGVTQVHVGLISIAPDELAELRKRSYKLECLENGKVHNWEWHDESLEEYFKRYPEG